MIDLVDMRKKIIAAKYIKMCLEDIEKWTLEHSSPEMSPPD